MSDEAQDPIEELFSKHGEPQELELTDEFLDHLAERSVYGKHHVSASEVVEAHETAPQYFENEGETRRAPVALVGPTAAGRMLTVPIEPSGRRGAWRPVSAYESNQHHVERYTQGVGHE